MTLSEFLEARIAEDEAAARACVYPPHDGYKPHPELSRWFYREDGEVEYVQTPEMLAHKYPERMYVTCDGEGLTPAVGEAHGEHIARHDPARVLAECAAKRRIIELRYSWNLQAEQMTEPPFGPILQAQVNTADAILRTLAMPYAGHPDYDETWPA